jgi:uncharacterized protein
MNRIITGKLDILIRICEKYNVSRLFVFGSATTENFSEERSDLDLLVELEPMNEMERGGRLLQLWDELESLFGRQVDLLTDQPIKNPYFRGQVESTKQLIYDRTQQKVLV